MCILKLVETIDFGSAGKAWNIQFSLLYKTALGSQLTSLAQYLAMSLLGMQFRSSHRRRSVKKGVLRNFAKFTGKHLCQRLLFNKVAGLRPATLLKKSLLHKCFPVHFTKFLRTPFLQNTTGRLLLAVLSWFATWS